MGSHYKKTIITFTVMYLFLIGIINVEAQSNEKVIGVPWDYQHKDTNMLCLQGCDYTGDHAWDSEHLEHRTHGDMYCVRASISMIANYFNNHHWTYGTLSQDRITYYMTEGNGLGPEYDLKHSESATPTETLAWALGIETEQLVIYQYNDRFYYTVEHLEDNRVILGVWDGHARVIDGYKTSSSGAYFHILDPWPLTEPTETEKWEHAGNVPDYAYFLVTPAVALGVRQDEESIGIDSDGDGLCDFDEENRFFTDPDNEDTDRDSIKDKNEILSYNYDYWNEYGPGYYYDYMVQKLTDDYPITVDGIPVALYYLRGNTPLFAGTKLDFTDGSDIGWHRNQPLIDLVEMRADIDGDGLRAERDSDSDNDGIMDNGEDKNRNGLFEWWLYETNPHIWDTIPPTTNLHVTPDYYVSESNTKYVTPNTVFTFQSIDDARSQRDIDDGVLDKDNQINTGIEFIAYEYYPADTVEDPQHFTYFTEPFSIEGPNGEYVIKYYSMDKHGNRETIKSVNIVLSDIIDINFLYVEGLEYVFNPFLDEPVPDEYVLEWSFGPTIKTGKTPSYTFPDNGLYQITLRALEENVLKKTQIQEAIVLDTSPIADFSTSGTYEEGSLIQFNDMSTQGNDPIVGWTWDFDGKATSNLQDPEYTFRDDGVYRVSLTVTDDDGSKSSIVKEITIENLAPTLELITPITVLEGFEYSYKLLINDPGILDYHTIHWDFGDNSIPKGAGEQIEDPLNPSHVYKTDGIYSLTAYVIDDDGGSKTISVTINVVDESPSAAFSWSPGLQDEGSKIDFTDLSTSYPDSIVAWSWYFAGLGTSSSQNPVFTFMDNGLYTVALTVTDDDGSTDTITHDVNIMNVPPTAKAGPDQTVDEGSQVSFSGSFTDPGSGDTHTIEWDFGDSGTASGTLAPSHTYADNGVNIVTLTVEDDDGGVGSDTLIVTVNNVPPTLDPVGDQYTPWDGLLEFTAIASDPGDDDLTFSLGGTVPDSASITAGGYFTWTPTSAQIGPHSITVIVTDDDGGSDSKSITVTVGKRITTLDYIGDLSGEYSDPITVSASLTDLLNGDPLMGKTITFTLGTQTASGVTDSFGVATATITLDQPSGPYTVTTMFAGDTDYASTTDSNPFTLDKERMWTIEYTGDTNVRIETEGEYSATVDLSAILTQQQDGFPGDLTLIYVTFIIDPIDPHVGSKVVVQGIPVINDGGSYTASVSTTAEVEVGLYNVIVFVDPNPYFRQTRDEASLFVSNYGEKETVTGGGWIDDEMSINGKGNFGFSVKYNKKGNAKGSFVYVYRTEENIYRVKSNSWKGGGLSFTAEDRAFFFGRCTIQTIDRETGETVESIGNSRFIVSITDADMGYPQSVGTDSIAFTFLLPDEDVWRLIGTYDDQIPIGNGNIVIHR